MTLLAWGSASIISTPALTNNLFLGITLTGGLAGRAGTSDQLLAHAGAYCPTIGAVTTITAPSAARKATGNQASSCLKISKLRGAAVYKGSVVTRTLSREVRISRRQEYIMKILKNTIYGQLCFLRSDRSRLQLARRTAYEELPHPLSISSTPVRLPFSTFCSSSPSSCTFLS